GQRLENFLWTAPRESEIQPAGDLEEHIPVCPRIGQRREGAADTLDSPVYVHERPVLLQIRRGWQRPMRPGGRGILVRPREHEQTEAARQLLQVCVGDEGRQVVTE